MPAHHLQVNTQSRVSSDFLFDTWSIALLQTIPFVAELRRVASTWESHVTPVVNCPDDLRLPAWARRRAGWTFSAGDCS